MAPSSAEIAELREQLREAHETIEAIRGGGVDSLVIGPPGQEKVYSLASADRPYRLIVQAMSEGAATVSPRGIILDVNPRLSLMTGQPGTQLVGTPVINLVPDAFRPELSRLLDVGAGDSTRGEVELTGPDGSTVPVLLAVGGFDLDRMLLRCLVLTDLTAQHTAEDQAAQAHEELREQNAVLEEAQETMGLGWWKLDPVREGVLSWSPATYRLFGLAQAEFDGKLETFFRLVHPDDAPRVSAAVTAALESSSVPFRVEHRILRPDGSVRWVQQSGIVERDDQGARRMLGICQDITYRKRIADENRESEERLRAIFDNAPAGIDELSPSGEFLRVNPRFCQITGYTAGELRSLRLQDVTHPDDRDADLASLQRLLSGEVDSDSIEKRYLRKDGDVVWAEVSHAVVRAPDGSPLLIVGVARDITAQRAAEAKVRALNAELEARVAQRTAELERVEQEPGGVHLFGRP